MPHIETNGIKMHYTEQGNGDPLLLIMGITAPGAVWEAHAEEWQKDFRCILGDNRGVGESDKPEGPYTSEICLLYTSPSPRDKRQSRMPSSA